MSKEKKRKFPVSDEKYGDVVSEKFIEVSATSAERVAIIEKNGKHYLCLQQMYVDRGSGEWQFGKAKWIALHVASQVLQIAAEMVLTIAEGEKKSDE